MGLGRLRNRVQLTTDGHAAYLETVDEAFGGAIDYAMLIKLYRADKAVGDERRYSPAVCTGIKVREVSGSPDPEHVSTSYAERQNLTLRMGSRRFTRLSNAFSKKVQNLEHALALHYVHYNFARIHKTLRCTPAIEAGISDHVWTMQEIRRTPGAGEAARKAAAGRVDHGLPLDAAPNASETRTCRVGVPRAFFIFGGPLGVFVSEARAATGHASTRRFTASTQTESLPPVDLAKPMEAVAEVRRCVDELGFKAIRVLPWLWEAPPTDRCFYPVYVACCEAGVPFCTQIGHTGPLMPSEVGRPIYLDQVCLDFPELVVVGGHLGYPWTDQAITVATKHESFFIDTSAYTVRRYPAPLVDYMKRNGATKVLFGTNFPMIAPKKALAGLDDLGLADDVRAAFLAGNAKRVFRL